MRLGATQSDGEGRTASTHYPHLPPGFSVPSRSADDIGWMLRTAVIDLEPERSKRIPIPARPTGSSTLTGGAPTRPREVSV